MCSVSGNLSDTQTPDGFGAVSPLVNSPCIFKATVRYSNHSVRIDIIGRHPYFQGTSAYCQVTSPPLSSLTTSHLMQLSYLRRGVRADSPRSACAREMRHVIAQLKTQNSEKGGKLPCGIRRRLLALARFPNWVIRHILCMSSFFPSLLWALAKT